MSPGSAKGNHISHKDRSLEESLAFALESGKMGTWDIDLEKNIVRCSPEMLRLWGIKPEEFNGDRKILQQKVHPADLQLMLESINQAMAKRDIYELEYRIIPSPGEVRWVLSRGRYTYGENSEQPVRYAGLVYDITDRKQKEEELAKAIRARDAFFMTAGHELRTPLSCLHLQIEVINWELKNNFPEAYQNEAIATGLKKQQEHLFRISQLIDNVLSEARSSRKGELSLQSESVDLKELVKESLDQIKIAAETSQTPIELTVAEKVVGFWDRFRIEQIIMNLFTNAIKYGNKKKVSIEVRRAGDEALLRVKDQGMGIAPENHERIFDQFERVINSQQITGLGLGLYVSRKIARAHGGDILVKSALNEGAEFILRLPLNP